MARVNVEFQCPRTN